MPQYRFKRGTCEVDIYFSGSKPMLPPAGSWSSGQ
jgi:hypothetical protein